MPPRVAPTPRSFGGAKLRRSGICLPSPAKRGTHGSNRRHTSPKSHTGGVFPCTPYFLPRKPQITTRLTLPPPGRHLLKDLAAADTRIASRLHRNANEIATLDQAQDYALVECKCSMKIRCKKQSRKTIYLILEAQGENRNYLPLCRVFP